MRLDFFKECSSGSYGRNCLQNCSENCYVSNTCDKKTGVCDGGCEEGWEPPLCIKSTCNSFPFFAIIFKKSFCPR